MNGGTLATPYALGMLLGIALLFFALRGFDNKHNLLGGKLSNLGAAGRVEAPAGFRGPAGSGDGTSVA